MQIVVLATWFPTAVHPGAGSFIARDAAELAVDHDVRVVHLAAPELDDGVRELMHLGVPVTRIPVDVRSPVGMLRAERAVRRHCAGADVLHTMAAPALLPFMLRRPHVPWVHTEHWSGITNLATGDGKFRLVRPVVRRAFSGPDAVVAVSGYLADQLRLVRREAVRVVGNIVDPMPRRPRSQRNGASLRVLGVGAVAPHKGWELAADAVALLRARGVPAELTWLGHGVEMQRLRQRGDVVAPGQVGRERVEAELGAADVFVLPTRTETFSLATVEALAAGVPPVLTGVGAHRDFVTDGVGVLAERDVASIADAITEAAVQDRERVRAQGERLMAAFSPAAFRLHYGEIYREVNA